MASKRQFQSNSTYLLYLGAIKQLDQFIGGKLEVKRESFGKTEQRSFEILEIIPTWHPQRPWCVRVAGTERPIRKFYPDDFYQMEFNPRLGRLYLRRRIAPSWRKADELVFSRATKKKKRNELLERITQVRSRKVSR